MMGKAVNLLILLYLTGLYGCASSLPPPGAPSNSRWPHLLADGKGGWFPAPGYQWNHLDSNGKPIWGDFAVHWEPGITYRYLGKIQWPHVIATSTEGSWNPEPGYAWTHPDQKKDLSVYWKPGIAYFNYDGKIQWPHIIASNTEGSWVPENGYVWLRLDSNGRPIPGDLAVQVKQVPPSSPVASSAPVAVAFQRGVDAFNHRDYATALREWQPLAQQGYAAAQHALGVMYETGRGVARNDAEAVRLYKQAAAQGHVEGQTSLAFMYETGRGVARNDAEAVRLYKQAAAQGDARAQNNLGDMYANGRGVARDYGEALRLFRQAAAQDFPVAYLSLGEMYEYGHGVVQNLAEAQRLYAKAAEMLSSDSEDRAQVLTAQQRIARQLATTQSSPPPLSPSTPAQSIKDNAEGRGQWTDFHTCSGITFSYALSHPPGRDDKQQVSLRVQNNNRFRVHVAFKPFFVSNEGQSLVMRDIADGFNPGTSGSWDRVPFGEEDLTRRTYPTIRQLGLRDVTIHNVERLVPNAYSQGEKLRCDAITVTVGSPGGAEEAGETMCPYTTKLYGNTPAEDNEFSEKCAKWCEAAGYKCWAYQNDYAAKRSGVLCNRGGISVRGVYECWRY